MALRRRGQTYLQYLRTGRLSGDGVIPYNTWRRWLNDGKVTEERLLELGINPGVQRIRTRPVGRRRQRLPHTQEATLSTNRNVSTSSAVIEEDGMRRPVTPGEGGDLRCCPPAEMDSSMRKQPSHGSSSASLRSCSGHLTSDIEFSDSFSSSQSSGSHDNSSATSKASSSSLSYAASEQGESDADESVSNDQQNRISSVLQSRKNGVDVLNQPLAQGLSITKFETLLMIFHLAMRHSLTDVFLEDLTNFVNELFGTPEAVPGSKWLFQKLFLFGSKPIIHFFCPKCSIYLGTKLSFKEENVTCQKCDWMESVSSLNGGHYFVTLSLKDQLKTLLERPNTKLITEREGTEGVISDVMDGKAYKKLMKKTGAKSNSSQQPLTINISTDGSPVYKNGRNTLYPIHFHLNEIPPQDRFNVENLLLAGLWFSKIGEPNLQIFLKPLVDELKSLSKMGVVWKKYDGSIVESPIYLLCCCADSVARPKAQRVVQFNSRFGCSVCEHPNTGFVVNLPVKKGSGLHLAEENVNSDSDVSDEVNDQQLFRRRKLHRYLAGSQYPLRTNKSLRNHMKLAELSSLEHMYGAKGLCALCDLRYLDIVFCFPLDYMHHILLGCVKKIVCLWFDTTSSGQPFYFGNLEHLVDEKLKQVSVPSNMAKPRPMSERCHWKAKEWRGFLLYYGLPCLIDVLDDIYFNHFKKFVTAIYILTKDSIQHDEIEEANVLLHEFVTEFQTLYGKVNMVFNIHGVCHLSRQVAHTGPLWTNSMFPFESANGRLVKLVKGTKDVSHQIARKYLMTQQVCKLLRGNYRPTVKESVLDFCSKIVQYKYVKNSNKYGCVTVLCNGLIIELTGEQMTALKNQDLHAHSIVRAYNRAVMNRTYFSSKQLNRQRVHNDSCVRLKDGSFAIIDLIFILDGNSASNSSDVWCLASQVNMVLAGKPANAILMLKILLRRVYEAKKAPARRVKECSYVNGR